MQTTKKVQLTKKQGEELIFQFKAKRKNGKISLYLKMHPLLVKVFKSPDVRESQAWITANGKKIKYYEALSAAHPDILRLLEQNFAVMDEGGGATLYNPGNGAVNIGLLRIKGIEKGVTLSNISFIASFTELQKAAEALGKVTRMLWIELVKPVEIKTKVIAK